MKKLIGTVAVAALLATAAFAEISFGGFGRGLWSVFGYDGDAKMTHGISWGGAPRVGIGVSGDFDNVLGFTFGLHADGGAVGIHDVAYVWGQPWDFLKIYVGMIQDDTLRVNAAFGQFDWLRGGAGGIGEDITFQRFGGVGSGFHGGGSFNGAEIAITPIEGLYIAAAFKMDGATEFVDVLRQGQYAVGYTIADLLAIKAQYIGGAKSSKLSKNSPKPTYALNSGNGEIEITNKDDLKYDDDFGPGIINAAVDLLMIENNFISVGAFIPTDFDQDVVVSAVYHGGFDALSLNALLAAKINDNFGLDIGVGVGYGFGNGLAIEGDVRTELRFPDGGDAFGDITIGLFLNKGFANGGIGVGAEVGIPFGKSWNDSSKKLENNKVGFANFDSSDKVTVAIPVRVQYWF